MHETTLKQKGRHERTLKHLIFDLLKKNSTLTTRQILDEYPHLNVNTLKSYVWTFNRIHRPKTTQLAKRFRHNQKRPYNPKLKTCSNCKKQTLVLTSNNICETCEYSYSTVYTLDLSKKKWKWALKKTSEHLRTPPQLPTN